MDDFFLFDMSMPNIEKIRHAVDQGRRAAMQKINQEFGSPVQDTQGYNKRFEQYRAIGDEIKNPFEISTESDLAGLALNI